MSAAKRGRVAENRSVLKVHMPELRVQFTAFTTAILLAAASLGKAQPRPDHKCDPVDPVADVGWSVVPTLEVVDEIDSAPYAIGNDWFVDRRTTLLPFCNYFNDIGNYSLRSYTLAPRQQTERVNICKADARGTSVAVAPYAGPCPPK
jgi:hypothetical protein